MVSLPHFLNIYYAHPSSDHDGRVAAFKKVTDAAKAHGSLIVSQLSHPGRQGSAALNPNPVSASDVQLEIAWAGNSFAKPRALTVPEIKEIVKQWGEAAYLCHKVTISQLHFHGRPASNHLTIPRLDSTACKSTAVSHHSTPSKPYLQILTLPSPRLPPRAIPRPNHQQTHRRIRRQLRQPLPHHLRNHRRSQAPHPGPHLHPLRQTQLRRVPARRANARRLPQPVRQAGSRGHRLCRPVRRHVRGPRI